MKKILWLTAMVMLVGMMSQQAEAVIEPTPDMFGVYFDLNADVLDTQAALYSHVFAYFILTYPVLTEVSEYEFGFQTDIGSGSDSNWAFVTPIWPLGVPPIGEVFDSLGGDVHLELPAPEPLTRATVLWSWDIWLFQQTAAHITVGPPSFPVLGNGPAVYGDGTNLRPMASSTCSGWINGFCPVAIEATSFGALKALYR